MISVNKITENCDSRFSILLFLSDLFEYSILIGSLKFGSNWPSLKLGLNSLIKSIDSKSTNKNLNDSDKKLIDLIRLRVERNQMIEFIESLDELNVGNKNAINRVDSHGFNCLNAYFLYEEDFEQSKKLIDFYLKLNAKHPEIV